MYFYRVKSFPGGWFQVQIVFGKGATSQNGRLLAQFAEYRLALAARVYAPSMSPEAKACRACFRYSLI